MRPGRIAIAILFFLTAAAHGFAQDATAPAAEATAVEQEQTARQAEEAAANEIADQIAVDPAVGDDQIADRIRSLLDVMQRRRGFVGVEVTVSEGVVFLDGEAPSDRQRNFAGEIARNVDGVVHVVNDMTVAETSPYSLQPAWEELRSLGGETVRLLPFLAAALVLLLTFAVLAWLVRRAASLLFERQRYAPILRQVLANLVALPILLIGVFLALRVSGLTRLALSVLGGTGLFGLVVGIAFRDIFENFLASLLISTNRPFTIGDLIVVDGHKGFVQAVTTRGTLLMTFDGNHIHVPNSVIYKATLVNLTSNPNMRLEAVVGIDYEDEPSAAQAAILDELTTIDTVLADPAPMVLVEELGASTVNLRCYFWVDAVTNSQLKVRSRVIRQMKRRLEADGFTMPDEQREIIFPRGVPVAMRDKLDADRPPRQERPSVAADACEAEGGSQSEQSVVRQQAAAARVPTSGDTLVDERADDEAAATDSAGIGEPAVSDANRLPVGVSAGSERSR